MSVVNATGSTRLSSVAQEFMRTFDRNRDGQLSTEEFTAVLNTMMQSLSSAASAAASGRASASSGTTRTDHLSGFNPAKLESSQSTKYRFARAAMEFDLSSVKDKASAEELLKQMKPAMERQGLEVLEISKDKIKVMHEGTPIWVDVIRSAATGNNTAFQWIPD